MPEIVNPSVTNSVEISSQAVLGADREMALGAMRQSLTHSVALALHNAVSSQQNLDVVMTATVARAVAGIQSSPEDV